MSPILWALGLRGAMAQEAPTAPTTGDSASPEVTAPVSAGPTPAEDVQEALASLRRDVLASEAGRVAAERLLDLAAVLLDDTATDGARAKAAADLGATGDLRALPLLRAAALGRVPDVQIAAMDAACDRFGAACVPMAERVIRHEDLEGRVRLAAVSAAERTGADEAGRVLWAVASDRHVFGGVRAAAQASVERSFPAIIAEKGPPTAVSDVLGASVGVLANGFAGGVALAGIGSYGQFNAAGIGGVGGALVGLGTGAMYVQSRPVTRGQGFAYASGVGWGFTTGYLGGVTAVGGSYTRGDREQDVATGLMTVGTLAGAGVGVWAARKNPRPADVIEFDTASYLGASFALSAVDLAYRPDLAERWDWDDCGYYSPYGYGYVPCDRSAYDEARQRRSRAQGAGALGGTAVGMAAGALLAKPWKLDPEDVAFATVAGSEAAFAGFFWPDALGIDDSQLAGTVRLPLHAAIAGALVLAEYEPISFRQSAVGAYGGVMGNAIGAGVPLAAGYDGGREMAAVMVPAGLVGTAAGVALGDRLAPDDRDWLMMGIGIPIAGGETAALVGYSVEKGYLEEEQAAGVTLLATGLVGTGLMAASPWVDVARGDSLVVGTGALWGGYYGVLVPVWLGSSGREEDLLLTGSLTADAFMAGAAVLVGPLDLAPRKTVVPQLGGVTGGTLGALAAAMATGEGAGVAGGAVIGSLVGTGAGIVLVAADSRVADLSIPAPRPVRLPGQWSVAPAPTVLEDGSLGVGLQVNGVGW